VNRREAEARVRRILSFREELAALERDGVLQPGAAALQGVAAYHDTLLEEFSAAYDTDVSAPEQQLSWGLRIASTLGAIAFALGVFLFFDYYWDRFPTLLQVGLVTAAPFVGWAISEVVARRFQTPYFTALAVLAAVACFVANLYIVGQIYNITPSPNAFLAWGLFALFLAYRHDLALVLGIALISLVVFAGGFLTNLIGLAWPHAQGPEFYLLAALLCLAAPLAPRLPGIRRCGRVYLFVGMLLAYGVTGWGMMFPRGSLLPFGAFTTEWIYIAAAFLGSALGIRQCMRAQWPAGTYLSAAFFVAFMLQRYFEWLWDELPNYVFFLVLGAAAVAVIIVLRRMRLALREAG
jgi:uncharacterized membrane protein